MGLVVPPLIFEAMIHLRASDLRAVIKPSLALATVGVLIATSVGGLILWKVVGLSPYVSFLFAALIAPTDTVTVLEVFRRVKVPSKLSTLLDTEAAFNDATGIVIFTLILSTIGLQQFSVTQTVFNFGFTLGAGVLIGLVVAFLGEILSSLIEDRVAETILAIAVVYGSYALATGIGASGLIAVAVAGLYFGNYTMRSAMEPATREAVTSFWAVASLPWQLSCLPNHWFPDKHNHSFTINSPHHCCLRRRNDSPSCHGLPNPWSFQQIWRQNICSLA